MFGAYLPIVCLTLGSHELSIASEQSLAGLGVAAGSEEALQAAPLPLLDAAALRRSLSKRASFTGVDDIGGLAADLGISGEAELSGSPTAKPGSTIAPLRRSISRKASFAGGGTGLLISAAEDGSESYVPPIRSHALRRTMSRKASLAGSGDGKFNTAEGGGVSDAVARTASGFPVSLLA